MKITDQQRLDLVTTFTKFNPFVIQRGQDPRKVIDATMRAAKKLQKAKTAVFVLFFAVAVIGCQAAPPYVPAPVVNATSLGWNASPDASVIGYNVYKYPPGATNWTPVLFTPATNAIGVLVGTPSGTAWTVVATNSVSESVNNPQITNFVNTAPSPAGALTAK